MDSITQIVLGASLCAAIAPSQNRRSALLAGAALGTLPDLDAFPLMLLTDNPVALMTLHRGLTHSLLILPFAGLLIWWICKRIGYRVRAEPVRWFWAIEAALVTHPLIDAFTVYGTQLWWPFTPYPAMWSSLFIIDPLYTIWLLLGCIIAFCAGARPFAQKALIAGLVLSTCYLGWSLYAKSMVDRAARETLVAMGHADAPYFSVPTAFNTLLWRMVALTPDGFLEGERSVIADKGAVAFRFYPSDTAAIDAVREHPDAARLLWFSSGFQKAQVVSMGLGESPAQTSESPAQTTGNSTSSPIAQTVEDWQKTQPADSGHSAERGQGINPGGGQLLVLSDLRMGAEPEFFFNFAVAERAAADAPWRQIAPQRMASVRRGWWSLPRIWQRIWQQPEPEQMF